MFHLDVGAGDLYHFGPFTADGVAAAGIRSRGAAEWTVDQVVQGHRLGRAHVGENAAALPYPANGVIFDQSASRILPDSRGNMSDRP